MMNGGMGGGMAMMLIFGVLLLAGLVVLVVVLVKLFSGRPKAAALPESGGGHGTENTRAREILDERYARGDVNAEEYRAMRRELGAGDP